MKSNTGISVRIRPAEDTDAASLSQIHFEAIRQTASAFYSPELIGSWAQVPDERRLEQFRSAIVGKDELFLVAEYADEVVGFGSIIPSTGELRAVYVHPDVGRSGVGSAILLALEQLATASGLSDLQMDSSINAEAFYSRHGYEVRDRGIHRLAGGGQMACVKMRKPLQKVSHT
ncbi:MAG: GNAT family N-acetyltransferase [Candidatus Sericytochromatia bacterium]